MPIRKTAFLNYFHDAAFLFIFRKCLSAFSIIMSTGICSRIVRRKAILEEKIARIGKKCGWLRRKIRGS